MYILGDQREIQISSDPTSYLRPWKADDDGQLPEREAQITDTNIYLELVT